jgi:hypothetical protein
VGESGFGRIHGEEGLREFTWVKATTRQRFPLPFVLTGFQHPKALIPMVKRPMRLRHGRGSGSGGLKSEAGAQAMGGHAEPSGSPRSTERPGWSASSAAARLRQARAAEPGRPPGEWRR